MTKIDYMDNIDFKQFIEDLNNNEAKLVQEKESTIKLFLQNIEQLYTLIKDDWLKEYIGHGISINDTKCEISEEKLGSYQVPVREIIFGQYKVSMQPVGTNILGSDARVDMVYHEKHEMFVRVGENIRTSADLIQIKVNGEVSKRAKIAGNIVWKHAVRQTGVCEEITAELFQKLLQTIVK